MYFTAEMSPYKGRTCWMIPVNTRFHFVRQRENLHTFPHTCQVIWEGSWWKKVISWKSMNHTNGDTEHTFSPHSWCCKVTEVIVCSCLQDNLFYLQSKVCQSQPEVSVLVRRLPQKIKKKKKFQCRKGVMGGGLKHCSTMQQALSLKFTDAFIHHLQVWWESQW